MRIAHLYGAAVKGLCVCLCVFVCMCVRARARVRLMCARTHARTRRAGARAGLSGTGLSGTGLSGTGLSGTGLRGNGLSGTGLSGCVGQVLEHDFDFLSDRFVHTTTHHIEPAAPAHAHAPPTSSAAADADASETPAAASAHDSAAAARDAEDACAAGECAEWQRVEWSEEAACALFDTSFGELWDAKRRRIRCVRAQRSAASHTSALGLGASHCMKAGFGPAARHRRTGRWLGGTCARSSLRAATSSGRSKSASS